jgi:hypothetical protein
MISAGHVVTNSEAKHPRASISCLWPRRDSVYRSQLAYSMYKRAAVGMDSPHDVILISVASM